MWVILEGNARLSGIEWRFSKESYCAEDSSPNGVRLSLSVVFLGHTLPTRRKAYHRAAEILFRDKTSKWLIATDPQWIIDLEQLASFMPDSEIVARYLTFLKGEAVVEPDVEFLTRTEDDETYQIGLVTLYITANSCRDRPMPMPPSSIIESLDRFYSDHPDPARAAFLMMRFGQTTAHSSLVNAIRDTLAKHGIAGLRADDKDYHDDLFPNVQTYLHGCGFGIAVFERIETQEFNPNVGLEVGYMMAVGKPVCLLKDRTLAALHTDLIGKLYKQFDVLNPAETIPVQLESWLTDRGLIRDDENTGEKAIALL